MSPFISFVLVIFMKEGLGMKRVVLLAAVAVFSVLGLLTAEFAAAADAPGGPTGPTDSIVGGKPLKGEVHQDSQGSCVVTVGR